MRKTTKAKKQPEMAFRCDGTDIFVELDGVPIARRHAKAWMSLEPGYTVLDGPNLESITVEYRPPVVQ